MLSCLSMWILLTVFAVALAQQPKVRRTLQKEIADYQANAEARALPPNKRPRHQRRRPPRRNGPPEPEAIGPMITTRKLQACHLRRVMPARVPAVRLRKASGCALRGVPDEPVERNDERPSD